ncbi:PQQ-binding-like beta-propeller repeat protein [Streptomyces litmocidini]|uniref:PQQ-binding-like beta-propeller repeat protein n=1 Tax=Streptomyces litmocidini TaxID=67318 RepID=A0ABW7UHR7_9ACTN
MSADSGRDTGTDGETVADGETAPAGETAPDGGTLPAGETVAGEVPGRRRGWRGWAAALAGVSVVLGGGGAVLGGILSDVGLLPGDSMELAWQAPPDRGATAYGNGDWLVGGTVVRSRFDAVTAFDAGSGKRRWEYVVPGRDEMCAVSKEADGSVALLAHGEARQGRGCDTVTALDLTSGRELWHTRRAGETGEPAAEPDLVATGGGLAVLRDGDDAWRDESAGGHVLRGDRALRAFDLRTGAPRWKAAVARGCVPHRVAAAARQVVAVLVCDRTELRLAAFDPADGKERWTVPLDRRSVDVGADVTFTSAHPLVVRVVEDGTGGLRAYLAFGPDGRPRGRVEFEGDAGKIDEYEPARVAVDGDGGRLLAVTGTRCRKWDCDQVVAFDLSDGRELWRAGLEGQDEGLALRTVGDRVTVLVDRGPKQSGREGLYVLDAATGDEEDRRSYAEDVDHGKPVTDLIVHDDLVVTVQSGDGARPFTAYRPW